MKDQPRPASELDEPPTTAIAVDDAAVLRTARERAHLSQQTMAGLIGIDASSIERLERGEQAASPELLDRYAQLFGLHLEQLMDGEAAHAPAMLLFRYLHQRGPDAEALAEIGAYPVLGEFLRSVRDVAELRMLLGEAAGPDAALEVLAGLRARPLAELEGRELFREAGWLAKAVRHKLNLGVAPIPSMIELLEQRLGVELFWVSPDQLDADIDAACTLLPIPAVMVNLVGGEGRWWRTRMTLAHELCHLLFDRSRLDPAWPRGLFLFSPRRGDDGLREDRQPHIRLPDELEHAERRANAFAACLLAPDEGVRALVNGLGPTTEEAVTAVCQHYQIGRTTAINRLHGVYDLSRQERLFMLTRASGADLPSEHPDRVEPAQSLRSDHLQDLALRALGAGRISRTRARAYLRLRPTERLPEHPSLDEAARAPLRTPEDLVAAAALRHLQGDASTAGCYPFGLSPVEGGGWRVEVAEPAARAGDPPRRRGHLRLSQGLSVIERDIA
ncbi:MAG: ImmA/IrrE family metallo-endopeptidase [Polyangiaceae bacterium]|nr:ImmA/IrrE family metallo-endopeptidase [Polyangiaceae bacterium]